MGDEQVDRAGTGRTTDGRPYVLRHPVHQVTVVHRRRAGLTVDPAEPDEPSAPARLGAGPVR